MKSRLNILIPAATAVCILSAVAFANVALVEDTATKADATSADHMSSDHMMTTTPTKRVTERANDKDGPHGVRPHGAGGAEAIAPVGPEAVFAHQGAGGLNDLSAAAALRVDDRRRRGDVGFLMRACVHPFSTSRAAATTSPMPEKPFAPCGAVTLG